MTATQGGEAETRVREIETTEGARFEVRQRPLRPLVRWTLAALGWAAALALYGLALRHGLAPGWASRILMVGAGLALFVGALALLAGLLACVPFALTRRRRVAFTVHPLGIAIESPARRGAPPALHRDEIAGPFVRIADVIDAEASATTMMRAGGEEVATMLAEGARFEGGADTLIAGFFAGSAGSVTVTWRGFTIVLAEALTRGEAEELAHRVALRLDRLPG